MVGVITQRNAEVEDPGLDDLYPVGVACMILKLFKLPDGNQSIIVHGLARFRLLSLDQTDPFAIGKIEVLEDTVTPGPSNVMVMAKTASLNATSLPVSRDTEGGSDALPPGGLGSAGQRIQRVTARAPPRGDTRRRPSSCRDLAGNGTRGREDRVVPPSPNSQGCTQVGRRECGE